jgi:hypothetical protein
MVEYLSAEAGGEGGMVEWLWNNGGIVVQSASPVEY